MASFKINLYTMLATNLLEAFTHPLIVGDHHVGLLLEKHLHQALTRCNYPEWALKRAKITSQTKKTKKTKNSTRDNSNSLTQKPYMVVPYYKGVSESLKKICGKHGVQVYFKGGHTIKRLLMNPKGQGSYTEKEWGHL